MKIKMTHFLLIFFVFDIFVRGALSSLNFTESEVEILSRLSSHFNSKFLVFTQEPKVLTIKLLSKMNIFSNLISFRQFQSLRKKDFARTLLVQKKIPGLDFYLKAAINQNLLPLSFLVFDNDSESEKNFRKIVFPFGFRLIFVQYSGSKVSMYEKFGFENGKRIPVETTPDEGNSTQIFVKENHYLPRTTLRLALVSETPCRKLEEQHVFQKIRCFHQEIFDLMATRLNFTKKIVECKDKANPYVFPNGSYSGLFKMLLDREVDASSGSFVVSTKRLLDFDFVWPTFVLKTMMYIKKEARTDYAYWTPYLKPFETRLWLTIAAYVAVSAAAVFYSRNFNRIYFNRKVQRKDAFDAFLTAFRIFCYQARFEISDSRFAKILQLVTSFAVTILFTAYSGSIVSSLTVHHSALPFHDLDGFFVSGKYKITAIADSFVPYFFREEYFPKKKILEKDFFVEFENLPKDDREGMDRICDGISAYVGIRENVFGLKHYKCGMIEIPRPIFLQYLAIGVPRNSPFREDFNRELIYLRTSGILKRMEFGLGDSTEQNENPGIVFSVAIWEIVSALVVLLAGCCIGWTLLLAEMKFGKQSNGMNMAKQETAITYHPITHLRDFNFSMGNLFID